MRIVVHEHFNRFLNRNFKKRTIYFEGEELEQPLSLYVTFLLFGIFWAYITVSGLGVRPISEWIGGLMAFDSIPLLLFMGMGKLYSGGIKTGLATAVSWFVPTPMAILLISLVR